MTWSIRQLVLGLFSLAMLTGLAEPAFGCSCVSMAPCEALWLRRDGGPIVFEATVVSLEPRVVEHGMVDGERIISAGTTTVHLKDIRNLLGEGATTIVTSGSSASCGYTFKVGQRYVIDAYRASGTLSTGLCSQTKPIEQAGALLAYIDSLSRPSPGATITGLVQASPRYSFQPRPGPRGLGNVKVWADGPVSRVTASASDGAFRFDGLPPGRYRIRVEPEDTGLYQQTPGREFELPNAHACRQSYVPLMIRATIEGSVLDAEGKPVSGASIALRRTDALTAPRDPDFPRFVGYATTRSDDLGHYEFEGIPPGQYVVGLNIDTGPTDRSPYTPVFLTGPGGAPEVIDFPPGGHRLLTPLVARPTTSVAVSGRVVWPDGRPGAGMRVRAFAHGETSFRLGTSVDASTDDDGRFVMNLPAGIAHTVRAFVDPDRATTRDAYRIEAVAEIVAGAGDVTLVLTRRP